MTRFRNSRTAGSGSAPENSSTISPSTWSVDSTPELVNSDPYEAGWLFEVSVADASQVDGLMDAAAYQAGLDG